MELEAANFIYLKKFYINMEIKDIDPLPVYEVDVFLKMRPIAEKLLARYGICSKGFSFIRNSLKYFEGAIVSATLMCNE